VRFLSELEQTTLLVLDNFEQLVGGAGLLATIVQRAPAVKLLVTSRERLHLRGEWLLDMRGLSYPRSAEPGEAIADYSAVQLFLETATRLQATFALSEEDTPHLVRICQQVEGMPLALELAAAWVRVLSCREIAREIEQSLAFLASSQPDIAPRHRSMMAVFDYSWRGLSPEEQGVFRSLAVFRGGFTREATMQVAGATLPLLATLIDKSMLQRRSAGRYELHELLRQYAAEKLAEAGETEQVCSRHLAFFLKLVETAEPKLQGVDQVKWLERLDSEIGKLRAALAWSLAGNEAEHGLRLAATLGHYWFIRGYFNKEGIAWLERVLSETDSTKQPAVRAQAFRCLGFLNLTAHGDDFSAARSAFEQSLALFRAVEDWDGIGWSLKYLGDIAGIQGDDAAMRSFNIEARSAFENALVILHEQGDTWRAAWVLNILGEIARVENDYAAARSYYEESLVIRQELGDQRGIAASISNLGYVVQYQGDVRQAATFFKESLIIFRKLGAKRPMISSLADLGGVAGSTKQPAQAARLFGAAEALNEAHGTRFDYPDQVEHDRNIAAVRAQLDEATFAAAWAEGRAMTIEEAVDYALAIDLDQFDDGTVTPYE
jgi:predicted ATPase